MRNRSFFPLLFAAALVFFLAGNHLVAITDPVESNYALTAKEMVLSGDWISPQIYGHYWYDKPVFLYWMLSLAYSLFGFTDFASRLPSALFGAASVTAAAAFIWHRTGSRLKAALLAAMTATSLEVWVISHAIITDQILFFFSGATMFLAYIGLTEEKKKYVIAAYAMAAGAVLTKGPVGLILPGTFLFVFALIRRNTTYLKHLFPPIGMALFVILCASWYGPMYAVHGWDFVDGLLGFNNVVRATVSEHPEANVWYYYVVLVPVSLLPWTGPCLYGLWKRRGNYDAYVFLVVWAAGTVLFYSLMATKYPTYAYIANLPLLCIGAETIGSLIEAGSRRLWTVVTGPVIFWWLLLAVGTFFARKAHFPTGSLPLLFVLLVIAIVLVAACQYLRAFPAIPFIMTVTTIATFLVLTWQVLVPFSAYRSSTELVPYAKAMDGPVYFFEEYETSFVYYTGKTAIWTGPHDYDESKRLQRDAVWMKKHVYPDEAEASVLAKAQQGVRFTLIVPTDKYTDFSQSAFAPYVKEEARTANFIIFSAK